MLNHDKVSKYFIQDYSSNKCKFPLDINVDPRKINFVGVSDGSRFA